MLDISQVSSNIMLKQAYMSYAYNSPKWKYETIVELYNYIYQSDPADWVTLELEAKLGHFICEGSYSYLYAIQDTFKINSNFQFDSSNYINFNAGIRESNFFTLFYHINKECELNKDIVKFEPVKYKEIMYISGKRYSELYNIEGKLSTKTTIFKQNKQHSQIRNNYNDFRISILKERPTDILDNDSPTSYRDKLRFSYKFKFFRLDMTIVSTNSIKQEHFLSGNNITYEVEYEFDEICKWAKDFHKFDDFYRIIGRFIDNVLCLYEVLSKEYFSLYGQNDKTKKFKENMYGNYFENNCKIDFDNNNNLRK